MIRETSIKLKSFRNVGKTVKFFVNYPIRQTMTKDKTTFGKWLKNELIDMGPSYIKIGQFISSRSDLFDKEISKELRTLQDKAPPFSSKVAKDIIKIELGSECKDLFDMFEDKPIACASISQVHRAKLKGTDEWVVIKIQRPEVRQRFEQDFTTLDTILDVASITKNRTIYDTQILLKSNYEFMLDELSFDKELQNIKKFREMFAGSSAVIIPKPYEQLCTSKVLTMEYVPSNKLARVIGNERRKELAKQLMEVFLRQVIEHGCIHADPHPGNIGITKEGELVLYDFGQVSRLDAELSANLRTLLFSVYDRDVNYITEMLIKSKAIILTDPNADIKGIKKLVKQVLKYFETVDFNEFQLSMIENNEFGFELPFKINPKLIMMFRSLSILEGMCKELDNDFSYFDVINEIVSDVFFDVDYLDHRARKDFIKIFDDISPQPQLEILQENIDKNNKAMSKSLDTSLQDYKVLMIITMCVSALDFEILHVPKVLLVLLLITVTLQK